MAKAAVKKETVEQKSVETAAGTKPEETQVSAPETVMVKNVTRTKTWMRQPSSGTRIDFNERKPMNNDGWLGNQVAAGFLVIE